MNERFIRLFAVFFLVFLSFIFYSCSSENKDEFKYKNPDLSLDIRVNDMLDRMTIEEKVGQLTCMLGWEMYEKNGDSVFISEKFKKSIQEKHVGMLWATLRADPWTQKTLSNGLNPELAAKTTNELQRYIIENTRLGIPVFIAEECPHGHMAIGTTVFPTSIGQASTWNPELIKKMAGTIALEARLQGTHIGYGPVLDLAREPRWSRVEETYGEDPVLIAAMGEAMVQGFQGAELKNKKNIISTLKHFVGYGNPEGGHNGGANSIGLRDLYQNYLYPFEKAVQVGAKSVMSAYNSIDGIPCTANNFLLKEVLREQWKFSGFTVSDLGSIEGLKSSHKIAEDISQASILSLISGLDVDLGGNAYSNSLIEAVNNKLIDISVIDSAVSRVLRLKFEMGLFEDPYVDVSLTKNEVRNINNIELAAKVARESVILLKNESDLLPLDKKLKNIAVIGPNADNIYNQLGDYTAPQDSNNIVTVLKGIKKKVSENTKVNYVKGCSIRDTSYNQINEAMNIARNSDIAIVVLGGSSARDFKTEYIETGAATLSQSEKEEFISDMESGEGFDRSSLDLMGNQMKLLKAVVSTGTPVVLVLIQGRPLNINWASENVNSIINLWYPGQEGGTAVADVIFGDYNPAGRLPISIPRSVGQLPVYYNYTKPIKHDYLEIPAEPLYPFGYGLSYTSFDYSNLNLNQDGKNLVVEFQLSNIGEFDGDEVVQLYLDKEYSSVVRPVKQLKKFRRIHLKKGETVKVTFILDENDLSIYNNSMKKIVEPGIYKIMIGKSSEDIQLVRDFLYKEN